MIPSMSRAAHRRATGEDLASLPEGDRTEVVDGELWAAPSPLPRRGHIEGALSFSVGGPFQYDPTGPGGWWIVPEVDVELTPHDVVRPDLSGWRRERMPRFPAERPVRVVPDWACEIVSPFSARMDRLVKPSLYLRTGVPHLWIVDPDARILEDFEARDGAWLRLGGWSDGDVARIAPFDAVEIDVGRLFPPEEPSEH
jgi:Uma2 family endonuclease